MSDQIKLTGRNTAEENRAEIAACVEANETYQNLRESIKRKLKFDISDKDAFPVHNRKFSWKKAHAEIESMNEADGGSSFAQVLRAGIQTLVNSSYETVPTTFEDWCQVVQSTRDVELYAPLQGIGFPREVGRQEAYPEVGAAGLDISIKNRKYGEVFAVEEELLNDDQTGQFQKQAKLIGEYLKLVLEVLAYGKLASVAGMAYGDLKIPTSETKPSYEASYPYSLNFRGGGANIPSSYGVLNQANIQAGIVGLVNQKNLLGLKMGIMPNRLIIGPAKAYDAAVLMHSASYPSGAAAAGQVGGAFAINPIKGMLDITQSRFMFDNLGAVSGSSTRWLITDDSKPAFIVQIREAASVVQEVAQSGESFNRDVMRFKGRTRCAADFVDPRFFWQGSDGSV